ncbi:hypothetical protein N7539_007574 [Penicillium diatomitis]|uniref:Mid2 domain-containing protein n=1 Tax=Penicillium diatomitis TaxID=2819901 RepID=A0A9W9WVS3_9EURO|nr:uncharacterized protein N7539_007574 [Penicillium diatomitis]KAJ5477430.1 hypothetical protein N7539_007574 [Penicillium diatomitis]
MLLRPRSQGPSSLWWSSVTAMLFAPLIVAQCYYPNGTLETDESYQPCPGFDGKARMCCATNRKNPFGGAEANGFTANKCLPNGLCVDGSTRTDPSGQVILIQNYWRDMCTSQDWTQEGCLNVCTNALGNTTTRITPCDNTNSSRTWCCGDTQDCCNGPDAIYIAATLPGYVANMTSPGTSTTAPTSTGTANPATTTASSTTGSSTGSTTSSSSSFSSSGLSTGAKAGIGIGVALGAIAILAGLAFLLMKRRRRNARFAALEKDAHFAPALRPSELSAGDSRSEVPASPHSLAQELPGSSTTR